MAQNVSHLLTGLLKGDTICVMTEVDITYCDTNTPTELYCVLPGQENPQPVTIHLNVETGELWANYNPEVGNSVDARAWHGIVRTWQVTADTSDERLSKIESEIELGVEAENAASVVVIEGLDRMLREYRDELREQARERLTEIRDELDELRAQRDELVRRIYGWGAGDSDRTLEALAGVSRATIARIRRHNNT